MARRRTSRRYQSGSPGPTGPGWATPARANELASSFLLRPSAFRRRPRDPRGGNEPDSSLREHTGGRSREEATKTHHKDTKEPDTKDTEKPVELANTRRFELRLSLAFSVFLCASLCLCGELCVFHLPRGNFDDELLADVGDPLVDILAVGQAGHAALRLVAVVGDLQEVGHPHEVPLECLAGHLQASLAGLHLHLVARL